MCSTYACRETRYRVDGWKIQSPPPTRQTPDEWLREELERDRAQRSIDSAQDVVERAQHEIQRFARRQRDRRR